MKTSQDSRSEVMLEAIRIYLTLLADPPKEERARLTALAEALDRLAMAYHCSSFEFADSGIDAPARDYNEVRKAVGVKFPELGLYATIQPGAPDNLDGMVGDAIDDLVDIANDLTQVEWLAANTSHNEAAWEFRYLFQIHWGRHLMDLRSHIHLLLHSF